MVALLFAVSVLPHTQSDVMSPRMGQLAARVGSGDKEAVERFWSDLKVEGTPIYEPGGEARTSLVTFVWRGDGETRNAIVNFDAEPDFKNLRMDRLPNTDVWYKTFRLPSQAQFYYQLSPNDSLIPFDDVKDWGERVKTFAGDPLNSKGITIGTQRFSFAILPGAPRIDAYRERSEVAKGKFDPGGRGAYMIKAKALGDHRTWIYTTPGLKPGPANLVVFIDGSGAWQILPSVRMFDNLFHDKKIGPTVALYTDSPDRNRDLACSDAYLDFLTKELLPWVREKYKVKFSGKQTVISGRSLGGLFAGYASLRRPDLFGNAMMQSPSLWWGAERDGENEWLTRQFVSSKRVSARFFVAPGLFETQTNSRTSISILFSSRHFRDVLKAKGYDVTYRDVTGGHDPLNWEVSLPEAIEQYLGKR